jgi:PPOX class probable F420-dependent enzyme
LSLTPHQVQFLAEQRVARLATVDEANAPHVVPICFAYGDGAIYTVIDEKPKRVGGGELRRVRNIQVRPDVCIVADRYDEDWSRLAWLQVRGRASLVADEAERTRALALLRARYPQYQRMDLESALLIRIDPGRVVEWAAMPTPGQPHQGGQL